MPNGKETPMGETWEPGPPKAVPNMETGPFPPQKDHRLSIL